MQYPADIFERHKQDGVFVDANLLLLFIIGTFNSELIEQLPRVDKYDVEDFELLNKILAYFPVRLTTPNVLTEVVNLIKNDLSGDLKRACYEYFSAGIQAFEELFNESKNVVLLTEFLKFGLTDAGIIATSERNCLVVTDDGALYGDLRAKGRGTIYFRHIHDMRDQF